MIKEVVIPEIGENIEKGDVIEILVAIGDKIDIDTPLLEFETDKAVVDIPSTVKGTVAEILVKKGDTVEIGKAIIKVETDSAPTSPAKEEEPKEKTPAPKPEAAKAQEAKEEEPKEKTPASKPDAAKAQEPKEEEPKEKTPAPKPEAAKAQEPKEEKPPPPKPLPEKKSEPIVARELDDAEIEPVLISTAAPASPTVRRLARELGADINKVRGSGPGGRISEDDVKAYVKKIVLHKGPEAPALAGRSPELPDLSKWGEVRREKMSRVRQLISESVSTSWNTVPHVTQFEKADITELEDFRKNFNRKNQKSGVKLTVTAILMKVLAQGLKEFPTFNCAIDPANQSIIYRDYVHIGIAVDTDRGLLVPVVPDVDKKSIVELANALNDVAERTRNKQIKPEELEGGTFTISNQGGIGGTDFTPIVLWPQTAILGVSRASMQPVYIEGQFEPRLILPLTLSYDHRSNDGADAARFLRWVVETLEQPLMLYVDK